MSTSFTDLGVSAPISEALAKRDILGPFQIQTLVMRDAIEGKDILAKSRTGSGKTLAFAIPIAQRLQKEGKSPGALVLVPTRELAVQVVEEFSDIAAAMHLSVAAVYGGVGIVDQARKAARSHIVVATPGRLEDLSTRRLIDLSKIEILVLDEADRMLDMGFQPQVNKIVKRIPAKRQTMFFSATLDGEVGRLARSYTEDPQLHEVESPKQTVEEVEHRFIPLSAHDKVDSLVELLNTADGLVLVFVRTKRGADRLVQKLKTKDAMAAAMHGDLTQSARERALKRFEQGKVRVLVATDVAARGLDLDSISHVVNFDPPEDEKAYVHRVGRTARAGRSGTGVTFVLPEQQGDVSRIARRLGLEVEFGSEGLKVLPAQLAFTSSRGRRGMMGRRTRRR